MSYRDEIVAKIAEAKGHSRANLDRTQNAIRQAEAFLAEGCRYSNHDFDVMNALTGALTVPLPARPTRSRDEQRQYDSGYAAGFRGRPLDIDRAKQSPAFEEGHDDGNCDRPTLDDLIPIDARKEAGNWWT